MKHITAFDTGISSIDVVFEPTIDGVFFSVLENGQEITKEFLEMPPKEDDVELAPYLHSFLKMAFVTIYQPLLQNIANVFPVIFIGNTIEKNDEKLEQATKVMSTDLSSILKKYIELTKAQMDAVKEEFSKKQ